MQAYRNHFIVLIGIIILGCSEWELERVGFTQVITIGAIEVGSNSAFLIGDIENIRESSIVESGFVVSSTVTGNEDLRIGQGDVIQIVSPGMDTISEDRAFAARATGLNGSTEYFFRAYVKIEGEERVAYGNTDQFNTSELSVSILSVNRTSGSCQTSVVVEVQVIGFAPGGSTQVGLVYSNDFTNILPTVENGIRVDGTNPGNDGIFSIEFLTACERNYFMQVVLNPESANPQYSNPHAFTMVEGGLWVERSSYADALKKGKPVSFAYGSTGYMVGGGSLNTRRNRSRMWSYGVESDQWTAVGEFDSLELSETVSMVVDGQVYITSGLAPIGHCGKSGASNLNNNGVDIDGNALTWESLCSGCNAEVCVVCGEFQTPPGGFDLQQFDCLCYNGGTIVFDPIANTTSYTDEALFGSNSNAVLLEIRNQTYVLGGETIDDLTYGNYDSAYGSGWCALLNRTCNSNMFQFNGNSITAFDIFSGQGRINLAGFAIGEMGFAGLGIECVQSLIGAERGMGIDGPFIEPEALQRKNDFYAFDPSAPPGSQWREVASYPGSGDNILAFSSDKHGFVVLEADNGKRTMWAFDPFTGSDGEWSEIGVIPNSTDNKPYHLFTIGNLSYIYFPATSNNFWMYIPEVG